VFCNYVAVSGIFLSGGILIMKQTLLTAAFGLVLTFGLVFVESGWNSPSGDDRASPAGAAELYLKKCASCHGKDGRAKTFLAKFNSARNLTDRKWQAEVSDERIFNSITNGKGKKMPSFGKKLSEPEINSLVVYVRGLKK